LTTVNKTEKTKSLKFFLQGNRKMIFLELTTSCGPSSAVVNVCMQWIVGNQTTPIRKIQQNNYGLDGAFT
jgi:hypothetical protein